MSIRLALNPNERRYKNKTYKGLPVIDYRGPLVEGYLDKAFRVIESALADYPRIFATRFDLMFPKGSQNWPSSVISRFIDNLKYDIGSFLRSRGIAAEKCIPRFIWAKERNSSLSNHYHVVLILNKDVFYTSGRIQSDNENLVSRIQACWCRALGLAYQDGYTLVHFPSNRDYRVNRNSQEFLPDLGALFQRTSYLAKEETKEYQDGTRHFGCSQIGRFNHGYSLQRDIQWSQEVLTQIAQGDLKGALI